MGKANFPKQAASVVSTNAETVNTILANRFLNERQLAERWNVSVKLLQKWRLTGDGPLYQKFGSAVRYSLAAIAAFEDVSARQNTTQF